MDSRFRKLDLLSLSDVESEIYALIETVGDSIPDPDTEKEIVGLISVAKSLGSKVAW
jgi:hypothetical protein